MERGNPFRDDEILSSRADLLEGWLEARLKERPPCPSWGTLDSEGAGAATYLSIARDTDVSLYV
ncbi:MAG: hypothetical protein U9R74_05890 [Pseudomonadota bacterium]|nr:hypothetical protein [Pseudomonadota bacterium]